MSRTHLAVYLWAHAWPRPWTGQLLLDLRFCPRITLPIFPGLILCSLLGRMQRGLHFSPWCTQTTTWQPLRNVFPLCESVASLISAPQRTQPMPAFCRRYRELVRTGWAHGSVGDRSPVHRKTVTIGMLLFALVMLHCREWTAHWKEFYCWHMKAIWAEKTCAGFQLKHALGWKMQGNVYRDTVWSLCNF